MRELTLIVHAKLSGESKLAEIEWDSFSSMI
jgi:hypothetical protein